MTVEVGEHPFTTLQLLPDVSKVAVADGAGDIRTVEMRTGRSLANFKGFTGGVRALALHPTLPYLAAVGLDRFLRVYDANSHRLLKKFYLKQRLLSVQFTDELLEVGGGVIVERGNAFASHLASPHQEHRTQRRG